MKQENLELDEFDIPIGARLPLDEISLRRNIIETNDLTDSLGTIQLLNAMPVREKLTNVTPLPRRFGMPHSAIIKY